MLNENTMLAFSDDIVVIEESLEEVRSRAHTFIERAKEVDLRVNETKAKYMHCTRLRQHHQSNQIRFEKVSSFVYLGSLLTEDNLCGAELARRINNAKKTFHGFNNLLSSKLVSTS